MLKQLRSGLLICALVLVIESSCSPRSIPVLETNTPLPAITQELTPGTGIESLVINRVSDNHAEYQGGIVPAFEKFEITFQVENSTATNMQMPYDPAPPLGVDTNSPAYNGISVDGLFTPDNWQTVYVQPAFYYQEFLNERRGNREWLYPTRQFSWKVRFAPDQAGGWQYRLVARDASGRAESNPVSFSVGAARKPGFVRVSASDRRYFEYEDGSYFPGLGYNMNFNALSWMNPVADNEAAFQKMAQNEIRLARIWLSQWGIYGSAWNPWNSIVPEQHGQYIPFSGLTSSAAYTPSGSESSMIVNALHNPCMFIGWLKAPPAVKQNTNYRIRIRYMTQNIEGPRSAGLPYGLTAKVGPWLYDDNNGPTCDDPGTGHVVTEYENQNSFETNNEWRVLEGTWNSGNDNFLPYFYLTMENVTRGRAFIDHVWIEEDLGAGQYGANIVSKPWMSHHLYYEQRNSYAFDQALATAEKYGITLRAVILEKNEWIFNRILPDGSFDDLNPENDHFYGEWRDTTKVRWLQQAWWRYLQARWGYSTSIHSWELLNEGDPNSTRHYALADEMGKTMHCSVFGVAVDKKDGAACQYDHPNQAMVSTSTWHSFPAEAFWGNSAYPNLDYADVHAYISTGWIDDPVFETDSAAYHNEYSLDVRARLASRGAIQPIIRGEAGIDTLGEQVEQADLESDSKGVWLHNFLWASLGPGGMLEQYWWTRNIEQQPGPDGLVGLHEVYRYFGDFLQGIPLNNGFYVDALAMVSNPGLRVIGQKDTTNQRAHLWVQNKSHTWRNVVDKVAGISGLNGTVSLSGFSPNTDLPITWHEFRSDGLPSLRASTASTDDAGTLTLTLPSDPAITDVGIKVGQ